MTKTAVSKARAEPPEAGSISGEGIGAGSAQVVPITSKTNTRKVFIQDHAESTGDPEFGSRKSCAPLAVRTVRRSVMSTIRTRLISPFIRRSVTGGFTSALRALDCQVDNGRNARLTGPIRPDRCFSPHERRKFKRSRPSGQQFPYS